MSIRILTTQLHQETAEHQRGQQFLSVRVMPEQKPQAQTKQTPFMMGVGNKKELLQEAPADPPPSPPSLPKIGLKERESQTTYGIPGGIAARFGRNALKEAVVHTEPIPIVEALAEPVQETITEEHTEEPEQITDATDAEDDAARITIELQSH